MESKWIFVGDEVNVLTFVVVTIGEIFLGDKCCFWRFLSVSSSTFSSSFLTITSSLWDCSTFKVIWLFGVKQIVVVVHVVVDGISETVDETTGLNVFILLKFLKLKIGLKLRLKSSGTIFLTFPNRKKLPR